MFNHVPNLDLPKLNRVTLPSGVRTYETPNGNKYPSVTTVTGLLKKDIILEWRKRVGNEEANRISSTAARRGTRVHTLCEKYLNNENVSPNILDQENWNQMKVYLNNINNIHALEQSLFSHHLQVAGTVDCIAEYNGKLAVIDFKTSKRNKTKDDIHDYFMQCSAYAVAFEEMTGIPVPNILVLISTDEDGVLAFPEKRNVWIPKFIDLRNEYKEVYKI